MTHTPRSTAAFALAAALVLAAPQAQAETTAERTRQRLLDPTDTRVFVVAHRGCWNTTAENALSAIDACVRLGVDMVELDVRRTRDGALVLMHDETVDRTTNGHGRVADLSLAEIRKLRLRAGAGGPEAALRRERVPTFAEAMKRARGRILVNLDAKADVYDDAFAVLAETRTADHILMKRRLRVGDPPLAAQAPFSQVLAMPIVDQAEGPAAGVMATQTAPAPLAVELIFTDPAWLGDAAPSVKAAGARIWVNTLSASLSGGLWDGVATKDPDAAWGQLISAGATLLQTDEPRALSAYLKQRQRRLSR
jgi:glycerophosphoryl diester phosphodiesterase